MEDGPPSRVRSDAGARGVTDPRLAAALEGRYRIERELGQGGMATVYLADDLKHERRVALKVLKPELAAVVGAERFLAEIKTTANLQHPHILPLFDSGEADSFLFYVMPYVEGETLRDRLEREHQLPVADAVQIAKDVAEALAYAHGHGVIHRDIKPANILIHSGRPVISDFGIALAVGVAGEGRLTETGLSLGTPHYMSPEQATGDTHIGPATDIYALGCVLYEMLVGEPPYTGSTPQAILGRIITESPTPTTRHRPLVPAHIEAAVDVALEKVPADRFAGATEFAKALGDPGFRHGARAAVGEAARRAAGVARWKGLTMAMTVTAALVALALGWSLLRPEPPAPVARFSNPFEEGQAPLLNTAFTTDGSALVYAGPGPAGEESQLWIRRWADLDATPIPGTEGAGAFALSPDDREVAFAASAGTVRIVGLEGGLPRTVVAPAGDTTTASQGLFISGITWGPDGVLYYAAGVTGINRLSATGGDPEIVTTGGPYFFPSALPDGRGLLVTIGTTGPGFEGLRIGVMGPEGGEARELFPGMTARYSPTGHIVYFSPAGALMAAPFDLTRLELTGPSVRVVEGVGPVLPGAFQWTLSETGTLLYTTGAQVRREEVEFVWVTRSGVATAAVPGHYFDAPRELPSRPNFQLSPEGNRVAFAAVVADNTDIWVLDLDDGVPTRLTFQEGFDEHPIWFPGGERIAFVSSTSREWSELADSGGPHFQVWTRRADGAGDLEEVVGGRLFVRGVAPDGETLILYRGAQADESQGQRNIVTFRPGRDSVPVPFLASDEFQELSPALSPDGRWLAYVSDETGQYEVFVRPFPNVNAGRWQVSTEGGMAPVWAHNGGELFYLQRPGRQLMSADFATSGSAFRPGRVTPLFTLGDEYDFNVLDPFYDIGPEDQRFLLVRNAGAVEAEEGRRFILVQNFFEVLKRRVPN